jgi:hypothetical protein
MWGFIGLAYMVTMASHAMDPHRDCGGGSCLSSPPIQKPKTKRKTKKAEGLQPYRLLEIFEEHGCVIAKGSSPSQLASSKKAIARIGIKEDECKAVAKNLGDWLKSKGIEPMAVWSLLNKLDDMFKKHRWKQNKQESQYKDFRKKNKV